MLLNMALTIGITNLFKKFKLLKDATNVNQEFKIKIIINANKIYLDQDII